MTATLAEPLDGANASPSKEVRGRIFVVGYMHSGTLLLQRLIDQHPNVYSSVGETKFFEMLPMVKARYPDLKDPAAFAEFVRFVEAVICGKVDVWRNQGAVVPAGRVDPLEIKCGADPDHVAVYWRVYDALAKLDGKDFWLEKTPTHVFYVPEISEGIPKARFVEIVRDVRDVLASKKTRRSTVWTTRRFTDDERPLKNLEKAYDPLWDTLSWMSAIRAGLRAHSDHPDHIHTLRYEDLAADAETQARAICDYLGVDYDLQMLQVPEGNSAYVDEAAAGKGGVHQGSVGKWSKVLTPGEAALCQWLARKELQELGYIPVPTGAGAALTIPLLLLRSGGHLMGRLVRRWRLGGRSFLRNVLRNYLRRMGRFRSTSV